MRPIISVVGKSGSGKTTLLEELIIELKKRSYKVAMVKHSHHAFDLDTPAKDTWRFIQAGSAFAAINSSNNVAIFRRTEEYFEPHEIDRFILWDYDLIITEGFKSSPYPKIEVHRKEQGPDLVTDPKQLLALVTDEPLDMAVPQFKRDEVAKIADLMENSLLSGRGDAIDLTVDNRPVALDPALQDLLMRTLLAMLPGVKGSEIKSLHLSLRRKR